MKSTGIVRKLDQLGRIVIPKEIRTTFDIKETDPIEIYVDGTDIILRKYQKTCIFCGESEKLTDFGDKVVCSSCLKKLKKL